MADPSRWRCWRETPAGARLTPDVGVNETTRERALAAGAVMFGCLVEDVRAEAEPLTIKEHEAAFEGAHAKAVDLSLMIQGGLNDGALDHEKHERLTRELTTAMAEMSYHYNEARRRRVQGSEHG